MPRKPLQKHCEVCGIKLKGGQMKYCSRKCYGKEHECGYREGVISVISENNGRTLFSKMFFQKSQIRVIMEELKFQGAKILHLRFK